MQIEQAELETIELVLRLHSLLEEKGVLSDLVNYLSQIEAKAKRVQTKYTDVSFRGYWQKVTETTKLIKNLLLKDQSNFSSQLEEMKLQIRSSQRYLDSTKQLKEKQPELFQISSQIIKGGKISVLGLDRAGKTTLLYRLRTGQWVPGLRPTVGMNSETIHVGNVRFTAWDLGGQLQFRRALWDMYTKNSVALIFVVDVSDPMRYPEARLSLRTMLKLNHLQNLPLAIFANKIDLNDEVDETDLLNILGLSRSETREIKVFKTSAKTGEGLNEGIYWLADNILLNFQQ